MASRAAIPTPPRRCAARTPASRAPRPSSICFYILFNAHWEAIPFTLPTCGWGERWVKVVDTDEPVPDLREQRQQRAGEAVEVEGHSMMVLRRVG